MCRSSINDAGAVGAVAAITPQDPDTAAAARAGVAQRPQFAMYLNTDAPVVTAAAIMQLVA